MPRALRISLRLATLVLSLSLVTFILVGGFWYVWQSARGRTPQVGYTITVARLEKAILWLYLQYRSQEVTRPASPGDVEEVTFIVDLGESVGSIAYRLEQMGLVSDAELFRRVVQYHGVDREIEAGAFALRGNMTMEEIMAQLQHGHVPSSMVTIPEGWRAEQIAALLEAEGVTNAHNFMRAVEIGRTDYPFLTDRPEGSPTHLEGFLFPDTYRLPRNASPQTVLDILLDNWARRVPEELLDKIAASDLTVYEVVTLASIVEREAGLDEERPLIAGVYLNRIRQDMRLEADPTVQYGKAVPGEEANWWPPLTREELSTVESPYNTYTNDGMPPGPICSPGLASIRAVVEPEESDYLYFLHKGDGTHAFATTYEEHLANDARYPNR